MKIGDYHYIINRMRVEQHCHNILIEMQNHLVTWAPAVIFNRSDLTHWGQVTHICVSKLTIIVSDNSLYSETTWAVGIAQLTHHEVQGGGQKSRDRRSRDFCPHRGPSGELIAQYRPPMSFCFYPTLYLGNHLYFFKPDSSWKQQKNTLFSEIDSVHSTKLVVMVTPQHLLVTS